MAIPWRQIYPLCLAVLLTCLLAVALLLTCRARLFRSIRCRVTNQHYRK